MNNDLSNLYKLKRKDLKKATEVFIKAFDSDPLIQYMYPTEELRRTQLPHYFYFRIRYGIIYGKVYAPTPKIEGLAIWFLNDKYKMTMPKILRTGGMRLYKKLNKEIMRKLTSIGNFSSEMHQKYGNFKHWCLAPIGVDPKFQGKGFGSLMIRAMLNCIDDEQLPSLLETQNPKNVELYKRYGYEVVANAVIPETDIPHWVMVRQPKK